MQPFVFGPPRAYLCARFVRTSGVPRAVACPSSKELFAGAMPKHRPERVLGVQGGFANLCGEGCWMSLEQPRTNQEDPIRTLSLDQSLVVFDERLLKAGGARPAK